MCSLLLSCACVSGLRESRPGDARTAAAGASDGGQRKSEARQSVSQADYLIDSREAVAVRVGVFVPVIFLLFPFRFLILVVVVVVVVVGDPD